MEHLSDPHMVDHKNWVSKKKKKSESQQTSKH